MTGMPHRGSKTALLAGLGVAAVVGAAVLGWKDLATQYHLLRLQGDPGYLIEISQSRDGSPERDAIGKFLRSRAGKEALFRAYYQESIGALKRRHIALIASKEKGLVRLNEMFLAIEWPPVNGDMKGSHAAELTPEGRQLRRAILTLIPAIEGETFRHPDEPAFVFQILRRDEALGSFHGTYAVSGRPSDSEDYLCLLLRVGDEQQDPVR